MNDDKTPSLGKLFLSEFADKNLVEYDECTAHYEALSSDDLIEEMEFLFNPPIWSISFDFTSQRYYAFLSAIINLAGRTRNLSDKQRSILVNIAILIRNKIRLRISPEKLAGFNKAVNFTLDTIRIYGLYPAIADLIDKEIMNYDGEFPINAIGEIIERRLDQEYAMAPEHVPERLFNDGADSFSAIQAFLRSNGDPVPLEQYAASLFRQSGAVGEDGSVDLKKLTDWKLRYAAPIALLPGLQDYLNGVEEASKKVEAAIAAKKRANNEQA